MNRVSRRSAAEAAEALLEAGRTEPVLEYDVELGLARHQDWLRHDAPLPEWASASAGAATKSVTAVVIKALVSTVVMGVLATAAWQARDFLQPSAASLAPAPVPAAQPAADPAPSESEASVAPIPLPVPEHAPPSPSEQPVRRDKRAARAHRAHREPRASAPAEARVEPAATSTETEMETERAAPEPEAIAAAPSPQPVAAGERTSNEAKKPRPPQQPEDLIEMQQLATAEQLLERSPARALALVRQGDQRFARGYFQQERAYIAIMALIRLGRIDEARTRAASFAKQFPALPYGARIRSALEAAKP